MASSNVRDGLGTQRVARDQGLRDSALGFLFGQAAEVCRHGIDSGSVKLKLQGVRLRQSCIGVVDDLGQAVTIGEWEIEVLDQRGEFGRHGELGRRDDDRTAIGGELLAYVAETADDDGVVHVAVKIFQDDYGFDCHRLHVGEGLHGFARVVNSGACGCGRAFGSQG